MENDNKVKLHTYLLNRLENDILKSELKKQGYNGVREYLVAQLVKPIYQNALSQISK